jgi:hypothetical protein
MVIKPKVKFDFKGPYLKNIFDREFFDMKQVHIKGEMMGYSKTTKLLLRLYKDENNKKYMELVAWKNKDKFILKNDCNKDILNWCRRSGIQI